jgi:hypothetical protein
MQMRQNSNVPGRRARRAKAKARRRAPCCPSRSSVCAQSSKHPREPAARPSAPCSSVFAPPARHHRSAGSESSFGERLHGGQKRTRGRIRSLEKVRQPAELPTVRVRAPEAPPWRQRRRGVAVDPNVCCQAVRVWGRRRECHIRPRQNTRPRDVPTPTSCGPVRKNACLRYRDYCVPCRARRKRKASLARLYQRTDGAF